MISRYWIVCLLLPLVLLYQRSDARIPDAICPTPMNDAEYERIVSMCSLSAAQRHASDAYFEQYRAALQGLDEHAAELRDLRRVASSGHGTLDDCERAERAVLQARERAVLRVAAADDVYFEQLHAILADAQQDALALAIAERIYRRNMVTLRALSSRSLKCDLLMLFDDVSESLADPADQDIIAAVRRDLMLESAARIRPIATDFARAIFERRLMRHEMTASTDLERRREIDLALHKPLEGTVRFITDFADHIDRSIKRIGLEFGRPDLERQVREAYLTACFPTVKSARDCLLPSQVARYYELESDLEPEQLDAVKTRAREGDELVLEFEAEWMAAIDEIDRILAVGRPVQMQVMENLQKKVADAPAARRALCQSFAMELARLAEAIEPQ